MRGKEGRGGRKEAFTFLSHHRAMSQNKELKRNMDELEEKFVKMTHQNMELASSLDTESRRAVYLREQLEATPTLTSTTATPPTTPSSAPSSDPIPLSTSASSDPIPLSTPASGSWTESESVLREGAEGRGGVVAEGEGEESEEYRKMVAEAEEKQTQIDVSICI